MHYDALLIDGNAMAHRVYHAYSQRFIPTIDDKPAAILYGFLRYFIFFLRDYTPHHVHVAFDTKAPTFRHKMDSNYKGQRKKSPDDFYPQMKALITFLVSHDVFVHTKDGYEADDVLGTLARLYSESGKSVGLLSSDLDMTQLLNNNITLLKPVNGGGVIAFREPEVLARFGVLPSQIIEYKALVGDSSDNYKGIPGVGPKAAKLLFSSANSVQSFRDLDHNDPQCIKLNNKIEQHIEAYNHSHTLATIDQFVPDILHSKAVFDTSGFFSRLEMFAASVSFHGITRLLNQNTNSSKKKIEPKLKIDESQQSLF